MRWASAPSPAHRLALLELAETAARGQPGAPHLQLLWARAAESVGRREEAIDRLAEACRRFPDHEPLHAELAAAFARADRTEEAIEQARRRRGAAWAVKLEFRLLLRTGRIDMLAEREAALARADPADPELLDYRSRKWRDEPELLLQACDALLAADPGAMHALYHKAHALAALGKGEEAAGLMAIDRFLEVVRLDVPEASGGEEAFLAALREEILANPTQHADPVGHATRRGLRTGTFPMPGDRAGTAMVRAIRNEVADFARTLSGDHPFAVARPREARFNAWALIFAAHGHQQLHHHPGPWLTGVYYVASPEGPTRPGALRIGGVSERAKVPAPWPVIEIAPVPGTLVLFPSYVPHETLPTGSEETRISVAFDVTDSRR